MKTEIPNETRYTHDFPSHYRKVITELERENAELRSLLREAITSLARHRAALAKEDKP